MGVKLSDVVLPDGFSWQFQEVEFADLTAGTYYIIENGVYVAVTLASKDSADITKVYYENDVDLDKDEYVIERNEDYLEFTFKAKYNSSSTLYEDYIDIPVKVRLYRGNLDARTFVYKTIYITYNPSLTASSIYIKTPWEWIQSQSGYYALLTASDNAYEMLLTYDPFLASDTDTIVNGGFPKSLFGKKENYNIAEVVVRIYVQKADYLKETVEDLLLDYQVPSQIYKTSLIVSDLDITLPNGFSYEDDEQSLIFGENKVAVIYNFESIHNPNFNAFGETLSERIYITINVVSPTLRGELSISADISNEVELTTQNGLVVVRAYESVVAKNGNTVPYLVTYYDIYREMWTEVQGTAEWINGSEVLLAVGYITRSINFYPTDKNFISGNTSTTFNVTIQITQVAVNTDLINFAKTSQTISYTNSPTLSRIDKVEILGESTFKNTNDIFYTYKKIYFDSNGDIIEESLLGESIEFTSQTILDAGGDGSIYEFAYLISAHFTRGYCTYFNFGDYEPSKYIYVNKAELVLSFGDMTRTYSDLIINNDTVSRVQGLEVLNKNDYNLYAYDIDGVQINLNNMTNAGVYTLVLELNSYVSNNYVVKDENGTILEDLTLTSTYIIARKEISDFTLYINGILRESGEIFNNRISVMFNADEFLNGEIPDYEIVYALDGKVIINVVSQGTYVVSVVFVGENYVVNKTHSFQVYEASGYENILLIAIIIGAVLLISSAIIISVRISRRKYKKAIQQEQLKRINKKIKDASKKKDEDINSNNMDNPNNRTNKSK